MQKSHTRWYDRKVNTFAEVLFLSRRIFASYSDHVDSSFVRKFDGHLRRGDLAFCEKMLDSMATEAVVSVNVRRYVCATSVKALFSKNEGMSDDERCSKSALHTWYKAERQCRRANRRIRLFQNLWQPKPGILFGQKYRPIIEQARREIHRVLGDKPTKWADLCKHGGGVSIGCSGLATSAPFKDAAIPYATTESAGPVLEKLVKASPPWFECVNTDVLHVGDQGTTRNFLTVVPDRNKLAFVPKNWKTHRSICVEPLGNLYIQQGLGREIALRLKRAGINIYDDGQHKHQEYAREASKLIGDYGNGSVTIDLSMASDTLCVELVKLLIPEEWYAYLDMARCRSTQLPDGSVVWTSKFSSMGNAATFPLETLIFWALAKAATQATCHEGVVSAYGDDIVVPRGAALLLIEVLRFCGFSVNSDKSFITGEFYESCGADYLGGVSVRPFYLKRTLHNVRDWYFLYNVVKRGRWAISVLGWDDRTCDRILRTIGSDVYHGPECDHILSGVPDGWLETSNRSLWQERLRGGVWQFRCATERSVVRRLPDDVSYITTLRGGDTMRRRAKGHDVGFHDTRHTHTVKRWATYGLHHTYASGA